MGNFKAYGARMSNGWARFSPRGGGILYTPCPFLFPLPLPVPPTLPHIPLPSHATLSRFYSSHLRAGHACKQVLSIFIPAPHVGFETRFVR